MAGAIVSCHADVPEFLETHHLHHTLVLSGALVLAWALNGVLSDTTKFAADELLFWGGVAADAYYYWKTKEIPYGRHAVLYVPILAWLATSAVWYQGWQTDYLPPSGVIDIAVFFLEAAFLIFVLMALGRDAVKPMKA